jgi:predicted RNase H-like HicB family nuclease
MTDYHIVYEETAHGFSAYTREEVVQLIREGITLHLEADASRSQRAQSTP